MRILEFVKRKYLFSSCSLPYLLFDFQMPMQSSFFHHCDGNEVIQKTPKKERFTSLESARK
jgi:hypothetical protein